MFKRSVIGFFLGMVMTIIYIKFDGKKHHLCAEVVLSLKMVFYDIWIFQGAFKDAA